MKIIMASKPSTCILDPIPTKLPKELKLVYSDKFWPGLVGKISVCLCRWFILWQRNWMAANVLQRCQFYVPRNKEIFCWIWQLILMVVQPSQKKLWRPSALLWILISLLTNISRLFQGHVFFHLRNIAKIWNFLYKNDAGKLIHAFVTSRLNCCNALLSSYPDKVLNELQLVLNTAARILTRTKKCLSYYSSASLPTLASC